jgi:hypothetical protein
MFAASEALSLKGQNMDVRLPDPAPTYAYTTVAEPALPPPEPPSPLPNESTVGEPVSSGLSDVQVPPAVQPYGDVDPSQRPAGRNPDAQPLIAAVDIQSNQAAVTAPQQPVNGTPLPRPDPGTPLGRADAVTRAVDDARGAWEAAKNEEEREIEAGPYHSAEKLRELRENTRTSEQRYRLALDAAVVESEAALHDAIRMAKRAGANVENDPQVKGCRDSLETAHIDRDWVLRDVLKRENYYGDRIDRLLNGVRDIDPNAVTIIKDEAAF